MMKNPLLKLAFCLATASVFVFEVEGLLPQGRNARQQIRAIIPTTLLASSNDNESTSAKVRFSGLGKGSSSTATTMNPIDSALSFISSDIGSIAFGLIGLILLVVERLSLPDASTLGTNEYQYAEKLGEETRSNLIAVLAAGSVLLNGISKLDVTSALAEAVELEGILLPQPVFYNDDPFAENLDTLKWGMESILAATPAKTVVVLQNNNQKWQVVSMLGAAPFDAKSEQPEITYPTPILDRFLKQEGRETYLPTLQALPGKTEFTYIPTNTQEVLILSIPSNGGSNTFTMLLGSNRAKSFTPRDVAWCQTIATRIGNTMSPTQ